MSLHMRMGPRKKKVQNVAESQNINPTDANCKIKAQHKQREKPGQMSESEYLNHWIISTFMISCIDSQTNRCLQNVLTWPTNITNHLLLRIFTSGFFFFSRHQCTIGARMAKQKITPAPHSPPHNPVMPCPWYDSPKAISVGTARGTVWAYIWMPCPARLAPLMRCNSHIF